MQTEQKTSTEILTFRNAASLITSFWHYQMPNVSGLGTDKIKNTGAEEDEEIVDASYYLA